MRLRLRRIRVLEVWTDTPDVLWVWAASTVTRSRCPHCGFKWHLVHETRERESDAIGSKYRPTAPTCCRLGRATAPTGNDGPELRRPPPVLDDQDYGSSQPGCNDPAKE